MMSQQPIQERSLVRKMAEIMKQVKYIQKKGFNSHNNYNYIKEEDVLEALRDQMAERNLMIFQNMVEKEVTESGKTRSGAAKFLTTIKMQYTIVDGDSGEERSISTGGQGEDTGDKGIYKATTGANKYALLKLFMIPTGDDPELDEGMQQSQQAPQSGQAPQQQNQQPRQQQPQKQQQRPPQQQGQGKQPSLKAKVNQARELLGWAPDQLIYNINLWLQKQNKPQIQKWDDLPESYQNKFYDIMCDRVVEMGGSNR